MRVGDRGEAVRRVQVALERKGISLPRYGADGDLGRETSTALQRLGKQGGIAWDGQGDVPEAILDLLDCGELPDCEPPELGDFEADGVQIFDLRSECPNPRDKTAVYRGRTLMRDPRAIDGIVIHQTGVEFGPPKDDPSDLGLARRGLDVACHAIAFRRGFVALVAPIEAHVHHADRLNGRTLGLEIDGNYGGLIGRKPHRGEATVLTDTTVAAARVALGLLVHEGRLAGCPLRWIWAHRQTDSWRQSDPGEELWRKVVLEYGVPVLGLETRPQETFPHRRGLARHGLPVPLRWDPAGSGRY